MKNNIEMVLCHSSIKIENDNIKIYIDPYQIEKNSNNADLIFITHSHYDHFSPEDILKVKNDNTNIIITNDLYQEILNLGFDVSKIQIVDPNEEYSIKEINFKTLPAYNINKNFHPKINGWVGYIINFNDVIYYVAGDTDITDENRKVKCDVAFIPIGGTYTMDYKEAANLINEIKPKKVIPVHYGKIVGNKENAKRFQKLINNNIECEIMI